MISFIIPAYNEELLLGNTLEQIKAAVGSTGREYEIIVVDDASTDRTAEIASANGAQVVSVSLRQIAAVRNAGAKVARGDLFMFVDADTLVPERTLAAALVAMDKGAVGGGARVEVDQDIPFIAKVYFQFFNFIWKPMKFAAGCFLFARRVDFEAVGGFDEQYYASEEIWLSKALKARGPFVILRETVLTSSRKARLYTPTQLFRLAIRLLFMGPKGWRKREGLDLWYDGQRETVKKS